MARRSCADLRLPGRCTCLRALLLPVLLVAARPCAGRRVQAREATRVSGLGLDSADSAETIEQQEDGSANPFATSYTRREGVDLQTIKPHGCPPTLTRTDIIGLAKWLRDPPLMARRSYLGRACWSAQAYSCADSALLIIPSAADPPSGVRARSQRSSSVGTRPDERL